jgi:hypothetical protein
MSTKFRDAKSKKRIMRTFKLNEISAVDRPAQAGAKMVMMKRADADAVEKHFASHIRGEGPAHGLLYERYVDAKRSNPGVTSAVHFSIAWSGLSSEEKARVRREEKQEVAARLAVSSSRIDVAPHSTNKNRSDPMTIVSEYLNDILQKYGVTPLCKYIIDEGPRSITEQQLVDAVGAYMKVATCESKASAFSRLYEARNEDGALLRKAVQVLRHLDMHGATASKASSGALDELNAKAAELRKAEPHLSVAQAFSKTYLDPRNRALVERERAERFHQ